jgi:hypothetical protein
MVDASIVSLGGKCVLLTVVSSSGDCHRGERELLLGQWVIVEKNKRERDEKDCPPEIDRKGICC